MTPRYKRVHVIINPASGRYQPMLNVINAVFGRYGIDWDATVTHKSGDAADQARAAIRRGVDLVAGYGGDGTQHEIANAMLECRSEAPMAILPGGTGNSFAVGLGVPRSLAAAVELICTSRNVRRVDAVQAGDRYFIQRSHTGVEREHQASRELKDHYGMLAYAVAGLRQARELIEADYHLTIDGRAIEMRSVQCHIVNSGRMGTGLTLYAHFSETDGFLDVFMLDRHLATLLAATERLLHLHTDTAGLYYWRGREITVECRPDRPVWTDGEYFGQTPIAMRVVPGALAVVVP